MYFTLNYVASSLVIQLRYYTLVNAVFSVFTLLEHSVFLHVSSLQPTACMLDFEKLRKQQ
jgi:hypothetical protein